MDFASRRMATTLSTGTSLFKPRCRKQPGVSTANVSPLRRTAESSANRSAPTDSTLSDGTEKETPRAP